MTELVCKIHGPYDASYKTCPHCAGTANRPPVPDPLDDDAPTDLGGGPYSGSTWDDEAPTELGNDHGFEDEDPTELGEKYRLDDVTELDFIDTSTKWILWVKEGHRRGHIYRIKDGTTIGRTDGDVILDDPKVSNPHAKFRLEDENFVIGDMLSKNGTFVNDERIREFVVLKENDVIKIGDNVFVLKVLQ